MNNKNNKYIFFAFRGDAMCFVHVLLNALDMATRGLEGRIILEGEAVTLVPQMARKDHFLHQLYVRARARRLPGLFGKAQDDRGHATGRHRAHRRDVRPPGHGGLH